MLLRVLILSLFLTRAATADDQAEIDGDALEALIQSCHQKNDHCRDYVSGVVDGLSLGTAMGLAAAGSDPNHPQFNDAIEVSLGICPEDEVGTDQYVQAVVSYQKTAFEGDGEKPYNPKSLVFLALRQAYPCK
jgi:hypothetical protein